jgi:hypothetical protein
MFIKLIDFDATLSLIGHLSTLFALYFQIFKSIGKNLRRLREKSKRRTHFSMRHAKVNVLAQHCLQNDKLYKLVFSPLRDYIYI